MPFLLRITYQYQRNSNSDQWNTHLDVHIQDLDVSVNRRQLIMMQNTLDNQLSDIRDVSQQNTNKASQELKKQLSKSGTIAAGDNASASAAAPPPTPIIADTVGSDKAEQANEEILQSKLSISIKRMKISLKQARLR